MRSLLVSTDTSAVGEVDSHRETTADLKVHLLKLPHERFLDQVVCSVGMCICCSLTLSKDASSNIKMKFTRILAVYTNISQQISPNLIIAVFLQLVLMMYSYYTVITNIY